MSSLYGNTAQEPLFDTDQEVIESPTELDPKNANFLAGLSIASEMHDSEIASSPDKEKLLQDIMKDKLDIIQSGHAANMRTQAQLNKAAEIDLANEEAVKELVRDTSKTPEQIVTDINDIQQIVTKEKDKDTALEDNAVDNIKSLSNTDPLWASLNEKNRDFIEDRLLEEKKAAILRNKIAVATAIADKKAKERPIKSTFDAVGNFLIDPFADQIREKTVLLGSRFLDKAKKLNDPSLSLEEFSQGWDKIVAEMQEPGLIFGNERVAADTLREMVTLDEDKALIRDGMNILAVGLLLASPAIKGSRALMGLFSRTGNKEIVAKTIAKELASSEEEVAKANELADSIEDFIDPALPIKSPKSFVGNESSLVQSEIDKNQFLLDELFQSKAATKPALSKEDFEKAVNDAGELFSRRYNKGSIISIVPKHDSVKKVNNVEILVGDKKGRVFSSKEIAEDYAQTYQELKSHKAIQLDDGGWALSKEYPVNELGYLSDVSEEVTMTVGPFLRNLTTPSAWAPGSTRDSARLATQKVARAEAIFTKVINRAFNRLNFKARKRLSSVISSGIDNQTWYDKDTFIELYKNMNNGLHPTEADWIAYATYRQASDTEFYIRNLALYRDLHSKGYMTVTAAGEQFTGKMYGQPDELYNILETKTIRVLDGDKVKVLKRENIEKLYEEGFVIVERAEKKFDKTPVPYEIYAKTEVTDRPLHFQQLGYTPGGHVHYADKYFISQRRFGEWEDGTKWEGPLSTRYVLPTKAAADEFVNNMNKAVEDFLLWEKSGFEDDLLREMAERSAAKTPYNTVDDVSDALESGEIVRNSKFFKRFDREVDDLDAGIEDYRDASNLHSAMRGRGEMYYSSRGDRLSGANGGPASLLNPYTTQSRAIANAMNHWAWTDFRQQEVKRWVDAYGPLINPRSVSINATPEEIIRSGAYKEEALKNSSKLVDEAESSRLYLKMQMRIPSSQDLWWNSRIKRLAEFVEGKPVVGKLQPFLIDKTNSDPVAALRGVIYDTHLGMFNAPQLFLQASSVTAALSISPKYGLMAAFDIPFFRIALINDNPELIKKVAEIRKLVTGQDPEDFIKSVNEFRYHGLGNLGNTLATLDASPHSFYMSNKYLHAGSKVKEWGRFFAQEGDRLGRITAWGIARREAKAKGLDLTDDAIRTSIVSRTDSLLLDQGSAGNLLWQRGIQGIPTQFWNYQFKMLSAMLPYIGNKDFTGVEKARLIFGQAFFHGTYGIPLYNYLADNYFKETGQELPRALYKQIMSGFLDSMLYTASGGEIDVNTGSYTGTGGFWSNIYEDLMDKPLYTALSGVAGSDFSRAVDGLIRYNRMYSSVSNPTQFINNGWMVLRDTISSTRVAHKAWMAYQTGKVYSKTGRILTDDVNPYEAFVMGVLNAQPIEAIDYYAMADDRSEFYQERVGDAVKDLKSLMIEFNLAEGQPAKQAEIQAALNNYSKILEESPLLHQEVLKRLNKEIGQDTMYRNAYRFYMEKNVYGEDVNVNRLKELNK